jgi:hypothetical protein
MRLLIPLAPIRQWDMGWPVVGVRGGMIGAGHMGAGHMTVWYDTVKVVV